MENIRGTQAIWRRGNSKINAALTGLSRKEYAAWNELDRTLRERLEKAVQTGLTPDSSEEQAIYEQHRRGLLYVLDEKFTRCYDKVISDCSCFLRDAAARWTI